jgi:hypothetical protein
MVLGRLQPPLLPSESLTNAVSQIPALVRDKSSLFNTKVRPQIWRHTSWPPKTEPSPRSSPSIESIARDSSAQLLISEYEIG